MILQLLAFLNASSDKYIAFEIIALLMGKKPPKPSGKLRMKLYIQLIKKPLKLNEKMRRNIGDLINEKPPSSIRKTRKKTDHLYFAL